MDRTARREREAGNGRTAFIFSSGYIYREKGIEYIDGICVNHRKSEIIAEKSNATIFVSARLKIDAASRAKNNKSSHRYICMNCDASSKQ